MMDDLESGALIVAAFICAAYLIVSDQDFKEELARENANLKAAMVAKCPPGRVDVKVWNGKDWAHYCTRPNK